MKNARAKRAKILFFHCQICKFVGFLLRSSSWLLKLPNDADDDDELQRDWKHYGKKYNDGDDKDDVDDDKKYNSDDDDDDCDIKEYNNDNDGQEDGIIRVSFNTSNILT